MEVLKKECRAAEKAVENAKKKSVYTDQTEHTARSFSASLREQLSLAEDKVMEFSRVKVYESFAVMKLTPELMDEYIESIEIHPGNDVRVIWK